MRPVLPERQTKLSQEQQKQQTRDQRCLKLYRQKSSKKKKKKKQKPNQAAYKGLYHMAKQNLSQECKIGATYKKIINVIHYNNRIKEKKHMIILDAKKAFDKIQSPFNMLEMEGNLLHLIKGIYEKFLSTKPHK